VYKTFEAYGVPKQDIELVKRMQEGSWYSVSNSFGETAACELRKGVKQGCPLSPPTFLSAGTHYCGPSVLQIEDGDD
jgi:hypothetical protein